MTCNVPYHSIRGELEHSLQTPNSVCHVSICVLPVWFLRSVLSDLAEGGLYSSIVFQSVLFWPYGLLDLPRLSANRPTPRNSISSDPVIASSLYPLPLENWRPVWSSGQLPGKDQLSAPCHGQPKTPPICRNRDGRAGVTSLLGGLPSEPRHPPSCSRQYQQRQCQCCLWQ